MVEDTDWLDLMGPQGIEYDENIQGNQGSRGSATGEMSAYEEGFKAGK